MKPSHFLLTPEQQILSKMEIGKPFLFGGETYMVVDIVGLKFGRGKYSETPQFPVLNLKTHQIGERLWSGDEIVIPIKEM